MKKYYAANPESGQEGPYDKDELNSLVQAGKYQRGALVWTEGMSEWEPIENHFTMPAIPPPLPTKTPPPLPTKTPPPVQPASQAEQAPIEKNNSIDWKSVSEKFWTLYGRISPKTFAKQAIVLLLISAVALVVTCASVLCSCELPHGHVALSEQLIFIGTIICAITSGIVFLLCFGGILILGIRRAKDSGHGGVTECFVFLAFLALVSFIYFLFLEDGNIEIWKGEGIDPFTFMLLFYSLYIAVPYVISSIPYIAFLFLRQPQLNDNQYGPCAQQDNAPWIRGKMNRFVVFVLVLNFCYLWSFVYWGLYSQSRAISSAIDRCDEDMLIRCIDAGAEVEWDHLSEINRKLDPECRYSMFPSDSLSDTQIEALKRMEAIILKHLVND